jgi:UDP-N-acetylmuramoyl-tripeptide--D-alanyl-D-alanine ligase
LPVSVVAITGSNGKTTTKELTAAVVARRYPTLASRGNFNNEIGVPLSLFALDATHRWAVLELGMNHAGEIDRLARMCRPDIGVITNIGPVHLEGLGSMEAIMAAKGELLAHLPRGGVAILNADDPRVLQMERPAAVTPLLFGLSPSAQIRGQAVRLEGMATAFQLVLPGGSLPVRIHAPGRFMVFNALAAAAVGHALGLAGEEIKAGLESFQPIGGRMLLLETRRGIHIIDDSYNANPVSMKAAAETLAALRRDRPGHLVCGDMLELGESATALHRSLGGHIAGFGFAGLYATGRFAAALADGAAAAGMAPAHIFTGSRTELLKALTQRLRAGDWVLVKGSRGMAMETLVKNLKQWADA